MRKDEYDVEVLAPAGSYEIFTSVINAGADAVYLGGDMFGARAFAGNFNKDELLKALDYAHLRDKKIYLTVNTLLKEKELTEKLIDYLKPFYENGLDAVIVQDFGVLNLIKSVFPDLHIHASTQMTITGAASAALLERCGVSRIVTARELTLSEISEIRKNTKLEIESFVHGALCYCYSGQCLLSSMLGNRSGNRGRCAQPCRLAYDVTSDMGHFSERINDNNSLYALSPKDMCSLPILPKVLDAGVNSLKIEGRMKNVTYAALVTSLYRKYVDMYLEKGKEKYKVDEKDLSALMDVYNRGSFTTGYYDSVKGKNMMSVDRPNHKGVKALSVVKNDKGRVVFKALIDINPQDVFEIDFENSFTARDFVKKGSTFAVNLPKKYKLFVNKELYRTKNNSIYKAVTDKYVNESMTEPNVQKKGIISFALEAKLGEALCLTAFNEHTSVSVYGETVDEALTQPVSGEKIINTLSELGNTDFVPDSITVSMDDNIFIPMGQIKNIRRTAVEAFTNEILSKKRRTFHSEKEFEFLDKLKLNIENKIYPSVKKKSILIYDKELLFEDLSEFSHIYIQYDLIDELFLDKENICGLLSVFISSGKLVSLALPHIITGDDRAELIKLIAKAKELGISSFLIRCLEEMGILGDVFEGAEIITDSGLYCWNTAALSELLKLADICNLKLVKITLPFEITDKEIENINFSVLEGVATEYPGNCSVPLMISKQCVKKTYGKCDKLSGLISISNKRNDKFVVKSYCDYCYTVMFGQNKLSINDDEVKCDFMRYDNSLVRENTDYKGHLFQGVE